MLLSTRLLKSYWLISNCQACLQQTKMKLEKGVDYLQPKHFNRFFPLSVVFLARIQDAMITETIKREHICIPITFNSYDMCSVK